MTTKHLAFLAKFAVSGLILGIVFQHTNFDQVAERLDSIRVLPLAAAFCCLFTQAIAVGTWRWYVVLRVVHKTVAWLDLSRMVFIGVFFNQILPSTFGGDGVRAWLLGRSDTSLSVALRSVVLDRALGLFGLFLLSLIASLILILFFAPTINVVAVLVFSTLGILLIAILPFTFWIAQKIRSTVLQKFFYEFTNEIRFLFKKKPQICALVLISLLGHVLNCLAVWYAAAAFGIAMPLGPTLVIVPPVLLFAALPISVAGWGVREGGMVIGFGYLGVSSSDAALVSVVIGLLGVAIGVLGGLVWVFTRPKGRATVDRPQP